MPEGYPSRSASGCKSPSAPSRCCSKNPNERSTGPPPMVSFFSLQLVSRDGLHETRPWRPGPISYAGAGMEFLIGPAELRIRRDRCRELVSALDGVPRQMVARCNACGAEQNAVIAYNDRYGLPIRTAVC